MATGLRLRRRALWRFLGFSVAKMGPSYSGGHPLAAREAGAFARLRLVLVPFHSLSQARLCVLASFRYPNTAPM